MPNVVLLSFSDLGKNQQLLNYARTLSSMNDIFIYVIGYDISNIPLEIQKSPNVKIIYLSQLFFSISVFNIILFPFLICFSSLQLIGILISLPNLDFILLSLNNLISDFLRIKIATNFKKTKIIFDLSSYALSNDHNESIFFKRIENYVLSFPDIIFSPTKAKQLILTFRDIKSIVMPIIPPRYTSIMSRVYNEKEPIVGILTAELEAHEFSIVKKIIQQVDETKRVVHFHIFCTNRTPDLILSLKELQLKNSTISFLNVNSKTYFNDLQQCYIGFIPHQGPVLDFMHSVLDMVGAGVPVIAEKYGCIREIVKDKENGFLYEKSNEILKLLIQSLDDENVLKMRSKLLSIHNSMISQHKNVFTKLLENDTHSLKELSSEKFSHNFDPG